MKYKSLRVVRKVGKALYISIPRVAQLQLRVFTGDWLELTLDDEARTLTLTPVHARAEVPLINVKSPDMVPAEAPRLPDPPGSPRRGPRETPLLEKVSA